MNQKTSRPTWDEYFMEITRVVSKRSTCEKRKVGAIIVKDFRVLTSGYNGAPKGIEHCLSRGCLRKELKVPSGQRHELCRGLHAEQNAIIQASWHGVKIEGGTMYCTNQPCIICVKMMINAGITELVYCEGYPDKLADEMLKESKVTVRKF